MCHHLTRSEYLVVLRGLGLLQAYIYYVHSTQFTVSCTNLLYVLGLCVCVFFLFH